MTKTQKQRCFEGEMEFSKGDRISDLGMLAKALGHPARVTIMKVLIEKGACLTGSLAEELPLAPSTVSEHLRILREAGLVQGVIEGPKRCYCVNRTTVDYMKNLLGEL